MDAFNKFFNGLWAVINGISRFVSMAAPIASTVGEITGNKEVKEAADQAKQVADFAEQSTRED